MIVHNVVIGEQTSSQVSDGGHKIIYVGCAESDFKYRDMLVYGRHRWELYSKPTIEFRTFDRQGMALIQCKPIIDDAIKRVDGVMSIVSSQTAIDPLALWEIDCAISNGISIVGVDVRRKSEGAIPRRLVGKMTRYGWEWFATFFNGL